MASEVAIAFLDSRASEAAPRLLGCELVRTYEGKELRVKIVETEAYDQTDVASHSYKGMTERTRVMFGSSGHLYVYFTYGMHYCCNIVVGGDGVGAAVLLRAVEPIEGSEVMEGLRNKRGYELTNGPAKVCQALAIGKALNGHDLRSGQLQLILRPPVEDAFITQTTRIGISKGKDVPWRFYLTDSPYVSRK